MAATILSVFQPTISSAASDTTDETLVWAHGRTAMIGFGATNSFFAMWISFWIYLLYVEYTPAMMSTTLAGRICA